MQQRAENEQQRPSPFPSPSAGAAADAAAGAGTAGITTAFGFFPSPSLSSPASTASHPSPSSTLSSSSASSSSPSAIATSFFHFPPAPSPPPLVNSKEASRRDGSDDDFSHVVNLCVQSLEARPPHTAAAAASSPPGASRATLPFSTSAHSLITAPVPTSPNAQWQAGGRQPQQASRPVRSRLRASAPPFQLQSPSASAGGSTSFLRFPSSSFPVLPSQLSSHEQHWGSTDTRKIGFECGSGGLPASPLHSFTIVPPTSLRGVGSPVARRPITPGLSSSLSVLSSPFTPSSAPTQSRSLHDPLHGIQLSVTTPITPTSASLYSPLLNSSIGSSSSSSSLLAQTSGVDALNSDPQADESLFSFVPQLPFDVPSDRDFLHEQPAHAWYMFAFRTSVCPLYRIGTCPHDAYTCFYAHSKHPRRRSPILHHGRYNYIPTRCRYLLEDRECPKGAQCRFAHQTEEVIYHPSKYKTQLCGHALDDNGVCTGYGMHCAKAHSEEDRRQPVYEAEEGQPRRWTADNFYEFQCPPEEREQGQLDRKANTLHDKSLAVYRSLNFHRLRVSATVLHCLFPERLYYLYRYKTQRCAGYPYNCQCDGLDWHRDEERRRGPAIRYAPMACPNVKPYINAEWGDPNVDCSGRYAAINAAAGRVVQWDCDYAHTLLELMYHPQVFKTQLCVSEGSVVSMGCGGGLVVERVVVGDVVMAWDGERGGLVRTEVLNVIERETEKECVELTFEDGRTLRCTPDHQLLTADGQWVEAQQLVIGNSRVQASSIPSLLFSPADYEKDEGSPYQLRLCGDTRYHFSTIDRTSCLRLAALARIVGLSVVAAVEVRGDDEEDESTWQCCVRRDGRMDAERLVADLELVCGEEVEWKEAEEEGDGFVIVLPPSLVSALHDCGTTHSPPINSSSSTALPPLRLPPLLADIHTPDWVYKECVAAVVGALPMADVSVDAATGHPQITFALPFERESVVDAVHSVVNSVRQRFQLDVQYESEADSSHHVRRVIFPVAAMRRIGVRYNARLELEMAKVCSAINGATLNSQQTSGSEGLTSAAVPCYSLALLSRRSCGLRRVFDLQVDSRLHSFVVNSIVVHNCDHFRQNDPHSWKCVWKRRCAHAHGQADLKTKEQAMEGWRQHLALIGAISPITTTHQHHQHHQQHAQHPSPLLLPSTLQQAGEEGGKGDGESGGSGRAVMRPLLSRWSEDVADEHAWAREKAQARGDQRERRSSLPVPGTTKVWSESSPALDKLASYSPYSGVQQSSTNRVRQHAAHPHTHFTSTAQL